MTSPEDNVLSTGSKLSTILRRKPEFIEQLALCLDREMRLIPNWRHLASKLGVDADVITRLEQYTDFSPTIRLFEFLEVTQPHLTIKRLKDALLRIRRNDLFSLLTTKVECTDSEKVKDVITSRSIQAPSLRAGLLDEIALALDGTSLVLSNWYTLAMELGVPRKTCWEFERRSTENPTSRLFQYLAATCPQMKLTSLKEALDCMERNDLLIILQEQNKGDDELLQDIMTPGSELLERMAQELNREGIPGVKNWSHLAWKLNVPVDVHREFAEINQKRKSPTEEVMKLVAAQFPDKTLSDVADALDEIQRNDAIQIISKQFPDTVGSALERLGCSLQESCSMPDPTGHLFSTSYRTVESDSLPKQDVKEQSSDYGGLPDRTYLVGRSDTCKNIMTVLSSNKAAEIVAPPGYGKTSVVIEVAHRMIERGKFVAYVKPRGVTCVEDLANKIIEALGFVPGEDTMTEAIRRIRAVKTKSVVLIVENIDNLLHLENQVSNDEYHKELESKPYCAKMRGKYTKDDFLTFLKDVGQSPSIHLVLTSRETCDFSVYFPVEIIDLEPLNDNDSATLFSERGDSLDDSLIKELVRVCGGIPLIICTVLSILKKENPEKLIRRLSTSSPSSLIRELNPDSIANEDRIDKCLQICFNRLSQENQTILVMFSTFPYRFTQEQFEAVFKTSLVGLDWSLEKPVAEADLQTCLNCLKQSSLLRFDRRSCHYSLHPFIRDFFSLRPEHKEAKSVFIRHYSDLAVKLCKTFLSRDSKSAIERYRAEKENIREAMAWCGDDHPELNQTVREHCINAFNKSAVFLAKMMRKQEFVSLFCKLAYRCRYDMHLQSACLTHIGMKIVLSCTCIPYICPTAMYRAKRVLLCANIIHSRLVNVNDVTRSQCLSKLGFCCVREGRVEEGYLHLDEALKLRRKRAEQSMKPRDNVMLAAFFNDLAASQMVERKHLLAIHTRVDSVLPVYEKILGDHPFVATTLNWIANSHHALGDYDNAITYTSRALKIREQLLGHHQETAKSLYDLGVAFYAKQDYESALKHLQRAIALQEEVLDSHEELVHTHQALSLVLRGLGRLVEAEEEMELAGECAKKLDSLKIPLEILETNELEKGWTDFSLSLSGTGGIPILTKFPSSDSH